VFLCETPGIWGALPKGFDHLWLGHVEAHITYNVPPADYAPGFIFKKGECVCVAFPMDLLLSWLICACLVSHFSSCRDGQEAGVQLRQGPRDLHQSTYKHSI